MRCEHQSVVVCESFGLVSRLMLVCSPALLEAEALSVHLQDMDMDSSENPAHGQQDGAVYNRHFGCVCYHPLFLFNQFGDCERATLRPGNVHSAEGWKELLNPVLKGYQKKGLRLLFRGDVAFAKPELYEYLEQQKIGYAIRLPANRVIQEQL